MLNLENVKQGDKIAVAVSGGVDSMCLLHRLLSLKQQLSLEIIAVNIDHGIRGKASEADSLFVKNYCEKSGVFVYFKKVDAVKYSSENKVSLEAGARVLRYEVFSEVLNEFKGYKIATAHHKNDLFESVLINAFRGTGIKGLKGIEENAFNVVRPLLSSTREEILSYAKENNIPCVTDQTNFDSTYTRNYIRNELAPLILKKFPSAINSVYNLSETAREEDDFIENYAEKSVVLKNGNYVVLLSEHPAVIKRAIISAIKKCGIVKDYEKAHIDGVYNLINLQSGSEFTLPQGVTAVKGYGEIIFYTNNVKKSNFEIPFTIGEINIENARVRIEETHCANFEKGVNCFDGSKISKNAVIRYRRDGDVFTKFGSGEKKLKDYFIDKKIPVKERDFIPLIAVGNEVLVVLGVEISEKVKITSETEYIIKTTIIKE